MFRITRRNGLAGCLVAAVALSCVAYAPAFAGGNEVTPVFHSLVRNAQIEGVVTFPSGRPATRAVVKFITTSRDGQVHTFTAFTNVRGIFMLGDVPPGRYTVTAESNGFSARQRVVVRPGTIHRMRIKLYGVRQRRA